MRWNCICWEASLILEQYGGSRKQFSYHSVVPARHELLHVAYTWQRECIKHVVPDPARFETTPVSEDGWLTKGPFSPETASFPVRRQVARGTLDSRKAA
ncbi:MAG: hypothetical protein OXN89_11125 [Bryobacterales bacterium]|nr:hypothetical protein [Bryobacterales bacterium]